MATIIPTNFNWQTYVQLNPDLATQGIDTEAEARQHYADYGWLESRPGVTGASPSAFDPNSYAIVDDGTGWNRLRQLTDLGATRQQIIDEMKAANVIGDRMQQLFPELRGLDTAYRQSIGMPEYQANTTGLTPEQLASFDVSTGIGLTKLEELLNMGATPEQILQVANRAPVVGSRFQQIFPTPVSLMGWPGSTSTATPAATSTLGTVVQAADDQSRLNQVPISTFIAQQQPQAQPRRPFESAVSQQDLDTFIQGQLAKAQQAQVPVDYTQPTAQAPTVPVATEEQPTAGFARGGSVDAFIRGTLAKKFADGGSAESSSLNDDAFIQEMMTGTLPTDQEVDPNTLKDLVRGVQYTPFDLLGGPVDIATMAMRPFGYDVEKPVLGSDWFIEQAAKRGLVEPSTGSGAELLGRIAGGFATPAVAKGVAKAGEATEGFIGKQLDTAAAKVEERSLAKLREQTGNPDLTSKEVYDAVFGKQVPGSAVVKTPGGEFLPYIEGFSKSPEDVASNITTNRLFNDEPGELHDWLKTKLPRYIRNQLGTAEDPLVRLTDENVEKAIKQLDAYDRRISKLQDDVRKREAEFGPGSAAATKARLDDEIEASENFLEETMTRLDRGSGYSPERFEEDVLRANVKNPAFQDTPDSLARRRKEAGFPEQGTARTYLGRRREDQLDDFLTRYSAQSISTYFPKAAGDVGSGQARKYLDQIGQDTEKPLYGISTNDPMSGPNSNLVATMNHVMDELNNAMRPGTNLPPSLQIKPESLNQFDIERAVRHVNKIDEWRLQQSRGADLEGGMKSAAVYKEYPDSPKGLRWVRLKADESLPKDEARKELQEALDREGNIMGHCVGLYCDPVLEGRTEIYSLRDSKGKSHVTIEVNNSKNTEIGTFLDEVPGQAEKYGFTKTDTHYGYMWTYPRKNVDGIDQSPLDVIHQSTADEIDKTIVNSPEFKQWLDSQQKQIRQIKGKGNDKQKDSYTPYVQDFVRTGNWDINNIGDFENTDLVLRGGKLYTKEEEAARIAAEMARVEPLIAEAKEFIYKDPVFDFIRKANKKRFDMSVNNPRFRRLEDIERFDLTPDGYTLSNIEAMLDDPEAYMDRGQTVLDVYQRVLAKVDEIKSNLPSIQKAAETYGPEVDRYAAGGEVTAFIKRQAGSPPEGEVSNDEFIQEMMSGIDTEGQPTSPVDTAVSDFISSRSKLVTDPKEFFRVMGENIEEYHGKPLREDPEKYLMEQLGPGMIPSSGLLGAIKPKGGIMPTAPGTPWGDYIVEVVGAAQKSYANIASDRREGVVDFIKKKLGKYIRSDFGTEEDPLRRAVESGRLETFGKDKDLFRSYALKAAREGDPDAVYDVTKAYDVGTGIRPTVMLPTRFFDEGQLAQQKAVDDIVNKIVAEGGDEEIARSIVETRLRSVGRDETDKALQTGEEGYSKVLKTFGVDRNKPKDMEFFERALDQGDIAYGRDTPSLRLLQPQNLADALGAIPTNKLASMDFPEAIVEGNRLLKKSRDFDEILKIADKGKGSTLPKETLLFGTKPLRTPTRTGQWVQITDPDAARLEGALMGHSVGGYGKEGSYNLGGKQALLSGKANLFSLRDEKGLPMVTVEMENMAMQRMSDREARKAPDFKVRQVQGKFNSAPEDYIDDVFDLAETVNGRWSEGHAGKQRYNKDRTGKDFPEPKVINWGELFTNRKAQGKAAGGEITKFIKDNR